MTISTALTLSPVLFQDRSDLDLTQVATEIRYTLEVTDGDHKVVRRGAVILDDPETSTFEPLIDAADDPDGACEQRTAWIGTAKLAEIEAEGKAALQRVKDAAAVNKGQVL